MKKFFTASVVVAALAGICYAAAVGYSDKYIASLKSCTPYSETYDGEVQMPDAKYNFSSKETIVGKQNGKCVITSEVFVKELHKNTFISTCAFTNEQAQQLAAMMVDARTNAQARQILVDTLSDYIDEGKVCQVKNLLSN